MRFRWWRLTCSVLLLTGLATSANENPPKEYADAMKSLAIVARGLPQALDARDHEKMNDYILLARPALDVVQKYWRDRDIDHTDEANTAIRDASKSISEISVSVHLMSLSPNPLAVEGAEIALRNFQTACTTCHATHRLELPNGTYRIK